MNKKILIIALIVMGLCACVYLFYSTGVLKFETVGEDKETVKAVVSVEDLENGCYYVWHNEKVSDIKEDLARTADSKVFRLCPSGDVNWGKDSMIKHTIWFTSSNDIDIPTLYPGDALLYISSSEIPYNGIKWERFADYGYTIGVANMIGDNSGHYRIDNADGEGYKGYIYPASDASDLSKYTNISTLFLDKIGDVQIREGNITDGGTVSGLNKDKNYVCEWYTGSYYQDFNMQANIHTFCFLESFTTYEYEFLHSNCISVTIPKWLKTGYYYVDDIGFFRYVSYDDTVLYNGSAYDAEVDWNDPIVIYGKDGEVIYDPITGVDKRAEDTMTRESGSDMPVEGISSDNVSDNDENLFGEYPASEYTEEDADGGAEEYENIDNELIIP